MSQKENSNVAIDVKILLVEDDLISQTVTKMILEEMGCVVDTALSGKSTLDYELNKYDMILLDMWLPDTGGIALFKKIREKEKQKIPVKIIPIIVYTSEEKMKDECFSVGFDGFITKPADFDDLKRLIQRFALNNKI